MIDYPPIVPTDNGWYLISMLANYDNIVTLTLDSAITDVEIGDSVIAENGAVGIVTNIVDDTITIKYNGIDFSEEDGFNDIHEGTVFDPDNVNLQTITEQDTVGPINTEITSHINQLAYYDSSDTVNSWKYFKPITGINISYDGNEYTWNNQSITDQRWKIIPL